jgi:hypothetical protein
MYPNVDMHTARPARLRPALQPHLFKNRLHLKRNTPHVGPADSRTGIQIDAQLIGMLKVGRPHRVRMQLNAAQVDDPGQPVGFINHQLLSSASRRKRKRNRANPPRSLGRRTLLIKSFTLSTVYKTLQHNRAIANPNQRSRCNRKIVAHEIKLGELCLLGKVKLVRMRDSNFMPLDREDLYIVIDLILRHSAQASLPQKMSGIRAHCRKR